MFYMIIKIFDLKKKKKKKKKNLFIIKNNF